MNTEVFNMPDGPELRAYLHAEERSVERLLALATTLDESEPVRAMYLRVNAAARANELLAIREWLDLR